MASSRLPPARRTARRGADCPYCRDIVPARPFNRTDSAVHHEWNRMKTRTKRARRVYSVGERGRNRLRIFPDPRSGMFQIKWRENGLSPSRSPKHRDWVRAKRQLTPTKAKTSQRSDRAVARMFLRLLGGHRRPDTLSQRDWDRPYEHGARAGLARAVGRCPIGPSRTNLKFLTVVLDRAAKSRERYPARFQPRCYAGVGMGFGGKAVSAFTHASVPNREHTPDRLSLKASTATCVYPECLRSS